MQTDDHIQPITRIIAVIVVPFLWLAFLILFFTPDLSGERFAWAIKPHMTAIWGQVISAVRGYSSMPSLARVGIASLADFCPSRPLHGS